MLLVLVAIVSSVAAQAASPAEITSTADFNRIVITAAYDRVAREFAGKAMFFRINIDKCPEIATGLGVSSIPDIAVLYIKDGELQVTHSVGALSYDDFVLFIKRAISLDTRK